MIKKIDHLVIATADMKQCISFYQKLGFIPSDAGGRYELFAGDFKINVHYIGHELEPKAAHVQTGSTDLCFELSIPLKEYREHIQSQEIPIELDIVTRHGARGEMHSIYLRDPDKNLLEFSSYRL